MITDILKGYGFNNFSCERDKDRLVALFKEDSLLFKRILRMVLHRKLEKSLNRQIVYSDKVEDLIPRSSRPGLIYNLERDFAVDFPKLVLSQRRIKLILLVYIISFLFITGVYIEGDAGVVYPYFFLYLALMFVAPSLILGLASLFLLRFFAPLDWDGVISVEDLLHRLIVDNYSFFSKDDFSYLMREIELISCY